jgi:hypothetical protein
MRREGIGGACLGGERRWTEWDGRRGGTEVAKGRALRRRKENGEGRAAPAAFLKWEAARSRFGQHFAYQSRVYFFFCCACALSRFAFLPCAYASVPSMLALENRSAATPHTACRASTSEMAFMTSFWDL